MNDVRKLKTRSVKKQAREDERRKKSEDEERKKQAIEGERRKKIEDEERGVGDRRIQRRTNRDTTTFRDGWRHRRNLPRTQL